jgi:hypothetical protein
MNAQQAARWVLNGVVGALAAVVALAVIVAAGLFGALVLGPAMARLLLWWFG